MERFALLSEFLYFIRNRRAFWLLPVVVALMVIGVLIVTVEAGGVLAPFIYPLF